jgi:metal-dependent amidase/aminoacylase/carboxypeptidase family protein
MRNQLMEMLESHKEEMIEIRRYLHENPELCFKE